MQTCHWIISGKTHGDDEPKSEDLPILEMLLDLRGDREVF